MLPRIVKSKCIYSGKRARVIALVAYAWSLHAIAAPAPVWVNNAWIRPSEQGTSAAAYLDITSRADLSIKGATAPGVRRIELRKMVIEGETVTMKTVDGISISEGQTNKFRLSPGQYHMVLMNIAHPLRGGQKVPLTLRLTNMKGKTFKVTAQAEVRYAGGQAGPGAPDVH
jgi:copper(I)-binding protein